MWLLSSEPQSAWLVLSHDPGAPPVVRFHQPFGSWACSSAPSSSSSNLNPIVSGPLHIINQSASLLFLFSTQLLYQREQPMAYIPTHPPPQKGRENLQLPPPTSHQATSYRQHLHHVVNPLCNSTSLTISLASLRHFYVVQIPQNSKFLLSCSL